jgi:aerobic-type carbon monoxide dehydrogenase small subunit (CoxS/CutS family)
MTVADVGQIPIITLEGLMEDGQLHPVQEAFIEEQAAQCGFCTNGMIIAAAALLIKYHHPNEQVIRQALDGNLCRCGSHVRILRAVQRAAELMWGPGE